VSIVPAVARLSASVTRSFDNGCMKWALFEVCAID